MNERETLKINAKGHLEIGGADCVDLVQQFGTPLYVFDEAYIRRMMRVFRDTLLNNYGKNGRVLYASKAFSCKAIYRIADEYRYRRRFGRGALYSLAGRFSRGTHLYARQQ